MGLTSPRHYSASSLTALAEELAALVRAGVPLERGLADLGQAVPGPLGDAAEALANRLDAGQTLDEALERFDYPSRWSALVRAGIASGRLATALEGLASFEGRARDWRHTWWLSWGYVLWVLLLAIVVGFGYEQWVAPPLVATLHAFDVPLPQAAASWLGWTAAPTESGAPGWSLLARLAWCWSLVLLVGGTTLALVGATWAGRRTLATWRWARFADLLGLLVANRVPLDEALRLTAAAVGDRKLVAEADAWASALAAGASPAVAWPSAASGDRWVRQAVVGSRTPEQLVEQLAAAGEALEVDARLARLRAEWLWPSVITGVFGGGAVLGMALALVLPLVQLYTRLAQP